MRAAFFVMVCFMCVSCVSIGSLMTNAVGRQSGQDSRYIKSSVTNPALILTDTRVRPASTFTGRRQLSIEECRNLALSRNLELASARLEEIGKNWAVRSSKKKMLPTLTFWGELSERNNYRWGTSELLGRESGIVPPFVPEPGDGVNRWSYGHERNTFVNKLELKWTPTDAALAYYLTNSNVNDKLKAHYKKVRVAQDMIATVDGAFYRLLGLQQAIPLASKAVSTRSRIMDPMRAMLEKQLKDYSDYHRSVEKSVIAEQELIAMKAESERQRNTLASAMGLSPDSSADGGFVVVGALATPNCAPVPWELEMTALQNRPEARVAGLDHLNSRNDLKKTIVKYFPKVTGFLRETWDNDMFIYEQNWFEAGMYVSFDLIEWLANHDDNKAASTMVAKSDREMANVALGIASKVRVASIKYVEALDSTKQTKRTLESLNSLVKTSRVKADLQKLHELALMEMQGDQEIEQARLMKRIGEANAALAELQGAVGTNYNEALTGN